ncbi:hypothetical protein JCM10207_004627 [Rhodosporidiobolus poonsookiae]
MLNAPAQPIASHASHRSLGARSSSSTSCPRRNMIARHPVTLKCTRKAPYAGREAKREAKGRQDSDERALQELDERLKRLEGSLQARLEAASSSLFPSLAILQAVSPSSPDCESLAAVEDGVRRLQVDDTLARRSLQSPFFPGLAFPDADNALDEIASLCDYSSLSSPPNPSPCPAAPWTQPLLPAPAPEQAQSAAADADLANLLCSLRRGHAFASMSLFPSLATGAPCPPSPHHRAFTPSHLYPSPSYTPTPPSLASTHSYPSSPDLSPFAPASPASDASWITAPTPPGSPLPPSLLAFLDKNEGAAPAEEMRRLDLHAECEP